MVNFTGHRRFEITNIVYRKVWDHRHTAIRAVVHRNTASKKKKKRVNTATPETIINHLEWSRGNLTIINGNGKLFLKNIKKNMVTPSVVTQISTDSDQYPQLVTVNCGFVTVKWISLLEEITSELSVSCQIRYALSKFTRTPSYLNINSKFEISGT